MMVWNGESLRNAPGHRGICFCCAIAVAMLCLYSPHVRGQSQKDEVCQGGYGGGCGTAPTRRSEPRQTTAHDLEIERYNEGVHTYNAAYDAYRRGDYATALDLYQQALANLPGDRDCLAAIPRTRGMMAYKKGDYATALDYYQQALAVLPRDQYLLNAVASIHGKIAAQQGEDAWNRKDDSAALAFYKQAFAYYPDNTWRDNIAIVQKALSQREEDQSATTKIEEIVDSFPKSDPQASNAGNLSFDDFDGIATGGTKKGNFGTNVSDPKLEAHVKEKVGTDTKASAGDQLLSAAKTAEHGGDLTPNYDRGTAGASGSLVFPKSGVDLSTYSERAKNDPRVITMLKELNELQVKRSQLERERDALVQQRNVAASGALMEQATAQLNKKEAEYQDNIALISQKTQDLEKCHREIDTEVEAPKAK